MRLLFVLFLTVLAMSAPARADEWPTSTPEAQGMSSLELAALVAYGVDNGFDSLVVARHGHIVTEAYYAPFPAGAKHRINSSTKAVVSTLISIAFNEGLLKSVDQPVLDFFPGRTFAHMDDRKKALTLRHLLDMTSGISWDEPLTNKLPRSLFEMERSPDWVQFVLDRPMVRDPGAEFEYNSGNAHLLSAILTKVTGKNALQYAREKLFDPLGIDDVTWRGDPQHNSGGGAGLYLLPRDMAKLGTLWLHDGVLDGKRLMAEGWIDRARHATLAMPNPTLHYANQFWSAAGLDIFMSVGFDRQLIYVMPKLDLVASFTGSGRYSNADGKLSLPYYSLFSPIDRLKTAAHSDRPLPEDPAAFALLNDRIKRVGVEARTEPAGPAPPLAAAISGKVYRLAPNVLRLSSLTLSFDKDEASFGFEAEGKRWGGLIGLDGYYSMVGNREFGNNAAKGRWLDDKTYRLEMMTIG
ncbi:MAG TPA: serine hydrolase, partial [Reyranella sp.]|nr:serine hydrolase [Reyranella sp.]